MTDPKASPAVDEYVDYDEGWDEDVDPIEEQPARPRRRGLTRVTVVCAAVFVAAVGFIAGLEVQKARGGDSGGSGQRLPGFPGAAGGGGGGGNGGSTAGTVKNRRGDVLYVTDADGNLVRVKLTPNSKITRTAKAKSSSVRPGDTVTIQGTENDNGTITASEVTATAEGSSAGGFPALPGGSAGGVPGGAGSGAPPAGFPGAGAGGGPGG